MALVPHRGIYSELDMQSFKESQTFEEIQRFVHLCGNAVQGVKISQSCPKDVIQKLASFFELTREWILEIPPINQPMRFGNKAFRQWHTRLHQEAPSFVSTLLPPDKQEYVVELSPYLCDSFGNETRIDYGTGHEFNIILFFLCLVKLEVIVMEDLNSLVLTAFSNYIKTMRLLQSTYFLEPVILQ
jgi:hypothetical protein